MRRAATFPTRPRRTALLFLLAAPVVGSLSCKENLPTGPATFAATLAISALPDTLVMGNSALAQVKATDASGNQILNLGFTWSVSDTGVAGLGAADTGQGRSRTVIAQRTGRSFVNVVLPDKRFFVANAIKQLTVVVGGVRISTSKDTTLSAINDTAVTRAAGLVLTNGVLTPKAGTGIRWVHRGTSATGTGAGDSLKFVARANGVDTLIALHDFCLAGARCADTAFIRVTQIVKLALSAKNFLSWSLGDSVGPSITLVDRRGNGLAGATIRFVPVTAADSARVFASAPVGISNPVTGVMAVPKLVATANGSVRAKVLAVGPNGVTVDTDSITDVIRQVARRIAVEALRTQMTEVDSIPVKPTAHDARGNLIADATLTATAGASGVAFSNGRAVGVPRGMPYVGTLIPALTGIADPANNPAAPQIPFAIDTAQVSVALADSTLAGFTVRTFAALVFAPTGLPAAGQLVRFFASGGLVTPDLAQTDLNGNASAMWTAPNIVGSYTFTALLRSGAIPVTQADSAGLVLVQRTLVVKPGLPNATFSTMQMSATTIPNSTTATLTVTVRDAFNNIVTTALPTDIVVTATSGTVGVPTCVQGVCTVIYTAPVAPGPDSIGVTINGIAIFGSPIALIIT